MTIYFLVYILVGMVAGTLSGLLGIGGGMIVVPGLLFVFQHQGIFPPESMMHFAAGTSLAIMMLTTSSSLYGHHTKGADIWPIYKKLFAGVLVGVVLGAIFADFLHTRVLEVLFGILVSVVSVKLLWLHEGEDGLALPGNKLMTATGFFIGGKSGMFGVGGGALTIPFLTHHKVCMRDAVGISSAVGLTVAIVGSICFALLGLDAAKVPHYTLGYIYFPAVLGVGIASPICAFLASHVSRLVHVDWLKRGLGLILVVVALRLFIP